MAVAVAVAAEQKSVRIRGLRQLTVRYRACGTSQANVAGGRNPTTPRVFRGARRGTDDCLPLTGYTGQKNAARDSLRQSSGATRDAGVHRNRCWRGCRFEDKRSRLPHMRQWQELGLVLLRRAEAPTCRDRLELRLGPRPDIHFHCPATRAPLWLARSCLLSGEQGPH